MHVARQMEWIDVADVISFFAMPDLLRYATGLHKATHLTIRDDIGPVGPDVSRFLMKLLKACRIGH